MFDDCPLAGVAEHEFLVYIQDILPARQEYGPLGFVHGLVVADAAQHLVGHPCLGFLPGHALGDFKQHVAAGAAYRTVHHVDAQLFLPALQPLPVELNKAVAAVQVHHGHARVLGLALAALIALQEVGMRRIEGRVALYLRLPGLVLVLVQLAPEQLFVQVGQCGTDVAGLPEVYALPETLDRGGHGRRVHDAVA